MILGLFLPASSGARRQGGRAGHHPRRICKRVKLRTGRHKVRRVRVCATRMPIRGHKVVVHTHSGGFHPHAPALTEGDEGAAPPLPVGPYRPPQRPPVQVALPGLSAASASARVSGTAPTSAQASGTGVTIFSTRLLEPSSFPASVWNPTGVQAAQEPSVAAAGRLVMYAFNWSAGYSRDGGQTFTEMDPHTVFPSSPGGFCCDQVVIFDPASNRFIWVLQYNGESGENVIRVAYTSAARLTKFGAKAWSWFDLSSRALAGAGHYLDQPRLGLTPRYLYMNINQADAKGVHKTVIVRIPRAAFAGTIPFGYGSALVDPWSLRVAQNVSGPTEYFVGHKDTSTLRIASVDDDSNYLLIQDIKDQSIADHNWTMTTPGGDDMLNRQASSQGSQVTGVTQDGDGNLWATWSEGRDVVDKNGNVVPRTGVPTQPHIAVVVLSVKHPSTGPPPVIALKSHWIYWHFSFALAMPDLATTADGDVGLTFDWGGGSQYLNHAVGFLNGGLSDVTVAEGTADPTWGGNPAGDYQTVRPLAPPHGNCLYAAGDVNRGANIGYPTLTLFSRSGVNCRIKGVPVLPITPIGIAPPPAGTTLTLSCPSSVSAGQSYTISGTLSPVTSATPITLTYTSSTGVPAVTHTVSTDSSGNFSDTAPGAPTGTETIAAEFAGDGRHAPSQGACQVTVEPMLF